MDVSTEKSKIMLNNTTNTSADYTMNGEKLEEVQCRYHHERREARRSDQLQVFLRNPVQEWYQYCRGPNVNCHVDRSDG